VLRPAADAGAGAAAREIDARGLLGLNVCSAIGLAVLTAAAGAAAMATGVAAATGGATGAAAGGAAAAAAAACGVLVSELLAPHMLFRKLIGSKLHC
jgi:hypothetical protein